MSKNSYNDKILNSNIDYDPISVEILWGRLIAIVDESANALVRSAFSTITREAKDFACVLMDDKGNSLAESTASIPCFNATLPNTLKHFIEKYPKKVWKPGDIFVTNDPWMGTGHLPDFTIAAPIFVNDNLAAFAGTIAHASDIGGTLLGADTQEVFQEGLRIPIMKLRKAGKMNEDLIEVIKANVRVPDQVMGDLHAQITALEVLEQRLQDLMREQKLKDLSSIAFITQSLAEESMRRSIKKLIPEGKYAYSLETDGFEEPLIINVTLIVEDSEITVDYSGTSLQLDSCAINSPMCYTYAYTAYPIKCAIDPEVPRNDGSYRPIKVIAPPGTIVNPNFPAAVNARHLTGHFLSSAIYGALSQVIPNKIISESGGAPNLRGLFSGIDNKGLRFSHVLMGAGGMGARPDRDGLSCTCFPSNSIFGSIEVIESETPLIFWHKGLAKDSGGPGKHRGGLGQRMVIQLSSNHSAVVSFRVERINHPALGFFGGCTGSKAKLMLYKGKPGQHINIQEQEGTPIDPKGRTKLSSGDIIEVIYPGGGGYGPPQERELESIYNDLKNDIISIESVKKIYKVKKI